MRGTWTCCHLCGSPGSQALAQLPVPHPGGMAERCSFEGAVFVLQGLIFTLARAITALEGTVVILQATIAAFQLQIVVLKFLVGGNHLRPPRLRSRPRKLCVELRGARRHEGDEAGLPG